MIQSWKRIRHSVYLALNRRKILADLRTETQSAWPLIESVWSRADGVYRTRVDANARMPLELVVLEQVIESAGCERVLLENLTHTNAYVAGYCLAGLERLNSESIKTLPNQLLERKELLKVQTGCVFVWMPLGKFAGQILVAALDKNG